MRRFLFFSGLAETPTEPILSEGEDVNDSPQTVFSQTSSAAVTSIVNALDDSVEIPVISTTASNETIDVTMMEETARFLVNTFYFTVFAKCQKKELLIETLFYWEATRDQKVFTEINLSGCNSMQKQTNRNYSRFSGSYF